MTRLRQRDLRRCMEFIAVIRGVSDRPALTGRLLDGLIDLVPGIQISYNEMDLRGGQVSWVAKPVDIARIPGAEEVKGKHLAENPAVRYFIDNPTAKSWVKVSDFMSRREFHRTTIYQEFYRLIATEHQIGVMFSGCGEADIGVAINRDRADFNERERLVLNALSPHVRRAYEDAAAFEAVTDRAAWLENAVETTGLGILEVTSGGRIIASTRAAQQQLGHYFGKRAAGWLPDSLQRWLAWHEARLRVRDDVPLPVDPLVQEANGGCLVVRAARLDNGHLHVLLEERERQPSVGPLRRQGLSGREAEVLKWVAEGKRNNEIAAILAISPRTVQHHLERVYEKLGVETRTAAAVSALKSLTTS